MSRERKLIAAGKLFRALREARGIPRELIALNLRMSASNWWHYEDGRNEMKFLLLPSLASSLGMPTRELIDQVLLAMDEADASFALA